MDFFIESCYCTGLKYVFAEILINSYQQHAFVHVSRAKKSKEIKNIMTFTTQTCDDPDGASSIPVGATVSCEKTCFALFLLSRTSLAGRSYVVVVVVVVVLFICADVGFRLLSIL